MKKILSVLVTLAMVFIASTAFPAEQGEIPICKRQLDNGTWIFKFPEPRGCGRGWVATSIVSGNTNIPAEFDRLFYEYTNVAPNPPDPWYCSDGTFQLLRREDETPYSIGAWSNSHGWFSIHFYKCIAGDCLNY